MMRRCLWKVASGSHSRRLSWQPMREGQCSMLMLMLMLMLTPSHEASCTRQHFNRRQCPAMRPHHTTSHHLTPPHAWSNAEQLEGRPILSPSMHQLQTARVQSLNPIVPAIGHASFLGRYWSEQRNILYATLFSEHTYVFRLAKTSSARLSVGRAGGLTASTPTCIACGMVD
jgi:hypothetical protein